MRLLLLILISTIVVSCKGGREEADEKEGTAWYTIWLEDEIDQGAFFNSELPILAGSIVSIEIQAEDRIEVGLVVKDGFDVSKLPGSIFMGTKDESRKIGGSPGIRGYFVAKDGLVSLDIENTTNIDTRIAVWTRRSEQNMQSESG